MGWEQVCPRDNNENSEEVQFLTDIIFMGNIWNKLTVGQIKF